MALSSPRARGAAAPPSSPGAGASSPRRCRAAVAGGVGAANPLSASPVLLRRQGVAGARRSCPLVACRAASFSSSGEGEHHDGNNRPTSTSPSPAAAAPAQPPVTLSADDLPPAQHGQEDAYASAEAAERLWRRLVDARRELAQAVEHEDFSRAAALRDEARRLSGALPPVRQYLLHQLERLRTGEPPAPLFGTGGLESGDVNDGNNSASRDDNGFAVPVGSSLLDSPPGSGAASPDGNNNNNSSSKKTKSSKGKGPARGIRAEQHQQNADENASSSEDDDAFARRARRTKERLAALAALAEAGDAAVLPDLARALRDPELQPAAQDAMWAVFGRSPDPRVAEMMEEGGKLLGAGAGGPGGTNPSLEPALAAFDRVLALSPDFAEAHNKRATVLYLLGRHEQAVRACESCLAVNPWHFGAASGAGLCHVALQRPADALRAFERALEIHPGLTQIARYAAALRLTLEERERAKGLEGEQDGGGGGGGGGSASDGSAASTAAEEGDGGSAAARW